MTQEFHIQTSLPDEIVRGRIFDFQITVQNCLEKRLQKIFPVFDLPETLELLSEPEPFALEAKERKTLYLRALPLAGGRSVLWLRLAGSEFPIAFDIAGPGFYGGDNHSHSQYSDGVNTIEENAQDAYRNKYSAWLWAVEHNNDEQLPETRRVTASYGGKFLSLSATEITTGYQYRPTTPSGERRGHALVYGYKGVPQLVITRRGEGHDWQDSIDEVTRAGGLYYLAHPFDETYPFDDVYEWSGYTGIEVWNGSVHASHENSRRAFTLWDQKNMLGERRYLGIAGTDGHTCEKIGGLGLRGYLKALTADQAHQLLRTGFSYGTNGPDLRFSVEGGMMGSTVSLPQAGEVTVEYEAHTRYGTLTQVRILGCLVTGKMEDYDAERAVLYERILSGDRGCCGSLSIPVSQPMFFRMEVKSTEAMPGSITGAGPEAGRGFAFSNPVWVTVGEADTARRIRALRYDGKPLRPERERFGVSSLTVDGEFQTSRLSVDAGAGTVSLNVIRASRDLELLEITVSAGGEESGFTYLLRRKQ